MSEESYQCAMCGGVFEKTRSDEEAMRETNELFGDVTREDCDVICDDCFKIVCPNGRPIL